MKHILFGVAGVVLGGSMLLYLVPQGPATGEVSTDTVAKVGDESVTVNDIRQQLNQIERNNQVPRQLESFYAQQILQNLVFQRELEYEAKRLGITVSDQERADRIRLYLPMAFNGGQAELEQEYRYKNEKIKLDYALIKPEDLEAKITPADAEIKAEYEKNKSKYQVP